jgi:hypothetical protein
VRLSPSLSVSKVATSPEYAPVVNQRTVGLLDGPILIVKGKHLRFAGLHSFCVLKVLCWLSCPPRIDMLSLNANKNVKILKAREAEAWRLKARCQEDS